MPDTSRTPTTCAWPRCHNFLEDFPQRGRWRYCPQHTYNAHRLDQTTRKFLNRRGFSFGRRNFLKTGMFVGLGLLFERQDNDLYSFTYSEMIPTVRASLVSLDLDAVRTGCRDLRTRLANDMSRDANIIRALASEMLRDAGPRRVVSPKDALEDLLNLNADIEKAWGEQHDYFNYARALIMRAQFCLTGEWYRAASASINAAIDLLKRCPSRDSTVKLMKSEALRVKLRIASLRGAMNTVEKEWIEFFDVVHELGESSVAEKADREMVISHSSFCKDKHLSTSEKLKHLDKADELFNDARKSYARTSIKPILAELGFMHQEIELDLIAGRLGENQRSSAAFDKLHFEFLPLLRSQPDLVHIQHLRSLDTAFALNLDFIPTPQIFSPTLPRLYEDAFGIAAAESMRKEF